MLVLPNIPLSPTITKLTKRIIIAKNEKDVSTIMDSTDLQYQDGWYSKQVEMLLHWMCNLYHLRYYPRQSMQEEFEKMHKGNPQILSLSKAVY